MAGGAPRGGGAAASLILRDLAAKFGEALARPPLWIGLVVPAGTLLITALFVLWPVRRAVQMDAVQAIRSGAEQPRRWATRLPHTSPSVALAVRDVLSRPLRSLLAVSGLGMAALIMVAAVSFTATVQEFVSDPGLYGFDGDLFVYPSYYMPDAEASRLIAEQPGVLAYYATRWGEFQLQGEDEVYNLRFREGDLAAFRFPIVEGRMLMLPMETGRRIQPDLEAGSYVLKVQSGVDAKAVAAALRAAPGDRLEVIMAGQMGVSSNILAIRSVMVRLSLVLASIAAIGILNSMWLSVQERRREFGMLKAVGMTPGQVIVSVLVAAAGLALVGYAVGVLVGFPGIGLLMDAVARSQGFGPRRPPLDGWGLALILPVIVVVAVAGALTPAYRAGRVSMVDVLRYE